jgi:anti-sigma-K factor RskA
MNYENAPLLDELAAQYALGTLRGRARRRFERICEQDPSACMALRRWEDRLLDLSMHILPVHPSALVWPSIKRRVRADRSRRIGSWSIAQWAAAAGLAALSAAIAWWTMLAPVELVATIADQQQMQLWRIEARSDRAVLRVAALPSLAQDAAHAYELWALPAQGGAPVSLGVMPQVGTDALQLNDVQRAAIAAARQVAISLEPVGGSPTGAPTGPVLFVAEVIGNG